MNKLDNDKKRHPVRKVLALFAGRKKQISAIYFFAFFSGIIQLSLPLGIQSIISFVLSNTFSTSLVVLITLVILAVLVNGIVQVNQMKLIEKFQQELFVRYSLSYAEHLPNVNLGVLKDYLPHKVNYFLDIVILQKGVGKLLLDIPLATIQLVFGIMVLFFYHPVFIVFGLFLLTILILMIRFSGDRGLETSVKESDYKYKVAAWLGEITRNLPAFKFSPHSQFGIQKTDNLSGEYLNARNQHFNILVMQYWWLIGLKVLITAVMFIAGTYLLIKQQLSIGQFIAAEILILTVIGAVEKIIINLETIYDTLTAVNKLEKILELETETSGKIQYAAQGNGIEIIVEGLEHDNSNEKIFSNLTIHIPAGKRIAITGAAGAGKTNLLRLFAGKINKYKGKLLINGLPFNNYDLASVRKKTGLILNNKEVFEGTIRENLLEDKGCIPINEVIGLAKKLGISQLFENSEDGLEKMLMSGGKNISFSDGIRIILLRNLIKQPELLLMDDIAQVIDYDNNKTLYNHILKEMHNTTVVMVTENEKLFHYFDEIYNLKDGALIKLPK